MRDLFRMNKLNDEEKKQVDIYLSKLNKITITVGIFVVGLGVLTNPIPSLGWFIIIFGFCKIYDDYFS